MQQDNNKPKKEKQVKRKVIDLRKATEPGSDIYICEHCDCRLIPYFDIKGERLTRGKLFQCGRCGEIKDTEMDNLQRPELLTSRGDTNNAIFLTNIRQPQPTKPKPFDVENEDDMLRFHGFHIVKTRITSGDGRILRHD